MQSNAREQDASINIFHRFKITRKKKRKRKRRTVIEAAWDQTDSPLFHKLAKQKNIRTLPVLFGD